MSHIRKTAEVADDLVAVIGKMLALAQATRHADLRRLMNDAASDIQRVGDRIATYLDRQTG